MLTVLNLENSYERGLVRQALLIASEQLKIDARNHNNDQIAKWLNSVARDMADLRNQIKPDDKTGW